MLGVALSLTVVAALSLTVVAPHCTIFSVGPQPVTTPALLHHIVITGRHHSQSPTSPAAPVPHLTTPRSTDRPHHTTPHLTTPPPKMSPRRRPQGNCSLLKRSGGSGGAGEQGNYGEVSYGGTGEVVGRGGTWIVVGDCGDSAEGVVVVMYGWFVWWSYLSGLF